MNKGQQYLQFFGSDPLKRLHGCAVAESDRGADSPCAGLARPLQRPQIGFGNPQAPIVFLSPSPLDPASASNEAFAEWLDLESSLEHHMTAETPQRYFHFVRAVLSATRKRLGQEPGKRDVLEHAFHTWAVHCATAIPDRVTDGAMDQCAERHLRTLLGAIAPSVIVAMGGPTARYFWANSVKTWDDFKPISALHGRVLKSDLGAKSIPVILSVHPYQTRADSRPDVVARAIAEQLTPGHFEAAQLKAA
ncbi:MAG TPA: uracil-DNA glycosylase family protein [Candidatus Dormibacteraeota bacterium]|nr:uracil-DNA glycosylase family protein [Candidatus Dormibacteraeota bacterium]